jgi:hypothetical protein
MQSHSIALRGRTFNTTAYRICDVLRNHILPHEAPVDANVLVIYGLVAQTCGRTMVPI